MYGEHTPKGGHLNPPFPDAADSLIGKAVGVPSSCTIVAQGLGECKLFRQNFPLAAVTAVKNA